MLTGIIAAILVCLLDIYFACLLGVLYKEFFPSGPNKVSTAGMNAGIGRCLLLFKRMLWAYLQLYISVNSVLKAFGSLPFWISFLASTWTTSACARELFCLTLLQFQLSRLFVVLCFISYFWEQGWLSFESTIIITPAYTFQRLVTVNTRGSHCPSNGILKPKKSLIKPVLVTHGCTDALASCHTKSRYTACHSGSQCHTAAPSSFFYRVKIHSTVAFSHSGSCYTERCSSLICSCRCLRAPKIIPQHVQSFQQQHTLLNDQFLRAASAGHLNLTDKRLLQFVGAI